MFEVSSHQVVFIASLAATQGVKVFCCCTKLFEPPNYFNISAVCRDNHLALIRCNQISMSAALLPQNVILIVPDVVHMDDARSHYMGFRAGKIRAASGLVLLQI